MSLRVLLADESDTIKKVFQLALQDLNVEVKTVQSGLDVVNVAQSFKPQIIFADVLLQKKNGYDTCLEIKQSPLSSTPVVLMWSSFMELDQEQYKKSQADDQLEKPFDADNLRNLVKKYVPNAASNPLSQFLKFPKSISQGASAKNTPPATVTPIEEKPIKEDTSEFNLNSILEDLKTSAEKTEALPSFQQEEEVIEMPSLDSPAPSEFEQFKIDTTVENLEKFESLNLTESASSSESVFNDIDQIQPAQIDSIFKQTPTQEAPRTEIAMPAAMDSELSKIEKTYVKSNPQMVISQAKGISDQEIEAIVRAHTEEFIKNQLQHSLLDIVERVVREELNKVLEEEVRLKQELQDDNP
ncbi:response regulator [bacterium]|nr:response regulator [bacterium]